MLKRLFKHAFYWPGTARRLFPKTLRQQIETTIGASEACHRGEIRIVIQHALDLRDVVKNVTPRQQAERLFGELRIWDTQDNSGILIYILLADHAIEIVADRGITQRIAQAEWDQICAQMLQAFRQQHYAEGVLAALNGCTALLTTHYPASPGNPNELPDAPILR